MFLSWNHARPCDARSLQPRHWAWSVGIVVAVMAGCHVLPCPSVGVATDQGASVVPTGVNPTSRLALDSGYRSRLRRSLEQSDMIETVAH
jgi:hypothetical protein